MYRLILITIITLTLVSGNVFDRTLKTSNRLGGFIIIGILLMTLKFRGTMRMLRPVFQDFR